MNQPSKHFSIRTIADGIYAAVARDGGGAMANVGFVDLGDSVLVFDSSNTQQAAAELRDSIASLTGKPVSMLINSHWHGDHVRGNQIFRDTTIVASARTRAIMAEVHPERIARQRAGINELSDYIRTLEEQRNATNDGIQMAQLHQQISFLKEIELSLPTLELVLPTETFETDWYLEGTDRKVECHTLGGGHTACDAFLYIPDEKVCFIGDLVANRAHMLVVDGDIEHWLAILAALDGMEIDTIVPGHGLIGGKELIGCAVEYLKNLQRTARELSVKGITPNELGQVVVIPDKSEDWSAPEVYHKNIEYLLTRIE